MNVSMDGCFLPMHLLVLHLSVDFNHAKIALTYNKNHICAKNICRSWFIYYSTLCDYIKILYRFLTYLCIVLFYYKNINGERLN